MKRTRGKSALGKGTSRQKDVLKLSFTGLRKFFECPRCFWYMMHGYKRPPATMPGILGARDAKIKKYYDHWRKDGLPPLLRGKLAGLILVEQKLAVKFRKGIEYVDGALGAILWGKLDDCLYDTKQKIYVPADNKSRGAFTKDVHPMDQFQLDVYTFLVAAQNLRVANKAALVAYADSEGFQLHEPGPWRVDIKILKTNPARAKEVFEKAVMVAKSEEKPNPSDNCRFRFFMRDVKSQIRKHHERFIEKRIGKRRLKP